MNVIRIYPRLIKRSSYDIIPITAIFASINTLGAKSFLNTSRVRPENRIIIPDVISKRNSVGASRYHISVSFLYCLLSTTAAISFTVFIGNNVISF